MDEAIAEQRRSVFAHPSFRLFYIGQAFSYVGDGLRTLAIPLLVFHITGSALSVGITYALEFFPFALAGLFGGSFADRTDRRRLMIACDFARFATVALFALALLRGFLTLPLIYVGITVIAVSAAFFLGGMSSSIPFLLGKERVAQANSALIATEQASNLIAPPVGGALFSLGGALPALLVNAVTYLISQIAIANIKTLGPDSPPKLPSVREVIDDIASGFRFIHADVVMATITWFSFSLNFFGMMGQAVYIPFYKLALGATDAGVGLSLGIVGLGAVAGSLFAGRVANKWPFGLALCIAYAVDGLVFVPVMFAHTIWLAVLCWSLANAGATFETTLIISWRMRIVPQEKIGRIFGAVRLIALIGIVPGTVIGGYLADHYGVRLPIVISTCGYLLVALSAFAIPAVKRDVR